MVPTGEELRFTCTIDASRLGGATSTTAWILPDPACPGGIITLIHENTNNDFYKQHRREKEEEEEEASSQNDYVGINADHVPSKEETLMSHKKHRHTQEKKEDEEEETMSQHVFGNADRILEREATFIHKQCQQLHEREEVEELQEPSSQSENDVVSSDHIPLGGEEEGVQRCGPFSAVTTAVSADGRCFTSTLTVAASAEVAGKEVKCQHVSLSPVPSFTIPPGVCVCV